VRHFDLYRVTDKSNASPEYFNAVHEDLDIRLNGLEMIAKGWAEAIQQFDEMGLQRLDSAMQPLYERLQVVGSDVLAMIQSNTFFNTVSTSSLTPSLGTHSFQIDTDMSPRFSPTSYLVAYKTGDYSVFMMGSLVSYDRVTGVLTVNVDHFNGDTAVSNWTICPSVPSVLLQDTITARNAAVAAQTSAQSAAAQSVSIQNLVALAQAAAQGAKDAALLAASNANTSASQASNARDATTSARDIALSAKDTAVSSASTASTAASNAQTLFNNLVSVLFNTYLGAFSTDPTAGYNGAPLQVGMLYYNSTVPESRLYDGSSWVSFLPTQLTTKSYVDSTSLALSIALG
jgi:hypothetical protein